MPIPPAESPKFVYAFISTNALGEEGPLAAYRNGMWLPLVVDARPTKEQKGSESEQ